MDTSETYILMCEKAEEIQALKKGLLSFGDYFSFTNDADLFDVWLPRQDQLQDMLRDIEKFGTSIQSITIACNFARFIGIDDEDAEGRSNISIRKGSMEQLWLAFVMAEKYGKVWNGKVWDGIKCPRRLMIV